MSLATMYPAQSYSPQTTLTTAASASDTTFTVEDGTKLPTPPNLLVMGSYGDPAQETILYTVKSGNLLSGITRAVEGIAVQWDAGTTIARYFTAKDYDTLRANITALNDDKEPTLTGEKMSAKTVAFTVAASRALIATGETLAVIFGKLLRYLTDLGAAAYKGVGTTGNDVAAGNHTHTGTYASATHATQHASGGADAITPAAIGAVASSAVGATSGVASLDADTKVTAAQAAAAIVAVTASLTLSSAHYGRMLYCSNASAITITIPTGIPVGTEIEIYRAATGTVTLAVASGVTIQCKETAYGIADQYTSVVLKWMASDTVAIQGNVG